MAEALNCWKCGASLADLPLPLARLDVCPACNADQHVCRMCQFYDTSVSKYCREPIADEVTHKERSNFCGYFQARPDAYIPPDQNAANLARNELDALFGGTPEKGDGSDRGPSELGRLFGFDDK